MTWPEFERILDEQRPRYYLTQVTAPTLRNDMYGVFLAKCLGAQTMAFGTHVTPMTLETMRPFPALDYVLRGEPEATLRELLDHFEGKTPSDPRVAKLVADTKLGQPERKRNDEGGTMNDESPDIRIPEFIVHRSSFILAPLSPFAPSTLERVDEATLAAAEASPLAAILGLAWRHEGRDHHQPRPALLPRLDDLPMPLHHLLPLDKQRMPMIKGPFTFIVTSRGCPAGCKYCIKHVSYQNSVRLRSPQNIFDELALLAELGIHNIHMYADLFTVNREQVVELCRLHHRQRPAKSTGPATAASTTWTRRCCR